MTSSVCCQVMSTLTTFTTFCALVFIFMNIHVATHAGMRWKTFLTLSTYMEVISTLCFTVASGTSIRCKVSVTGSDTERRRWLVIIRTLAGDINTWWTFTCTTHKQQPVQSVQSKLFVCKTPYAISYWWSFETKPLSPTDSETFNGECDAMVDIAFIWPLKKGQGHSFWYQSISHTRLPICAVNRNFFTRMHRLATIHSVTDRRQTDACMSHKRERCLYGRLNSKAYNAKHGKTKLPWLSHLLRLSATKQSGFVLQCAVGQYKAQK